MSLLLLVIVRIIFQTQAICKFRFFYASLPYPCIPNSGNYWFVIEYRSKHFCSHLLINVFCQQNQGLRSKCFKYVLHSCRQSGLVQMILQFSFARKWAYFETNVMDFIFFFYRLNERTFSLWGFMANHMSEYMNPLYAPEQHSDLLKPNLAPQNFKWVLWFYAFSI